MEIKVGCHAGLNGEEIPNCLFWGDAAIAVAEVMDRWLAPDHRYFKCRGDDGGLYLIRHDVASGQWELVYFSLTEKLPPGNDPF